MIFQIDDATKQMLIENLICMRLRPKLLEKSYQELELNFR
ncbi:hypothetical protein HF086_018281 [Spodoptera exigua]|uniref:Uncharacterized protein n=1 Tax=Spodoptera exigua TaxID=7107 RepID=A0A922M1D7_SPOEX|nr:hypothetical protein HF086_018281 [Spodoptera exigua]